MILNYRKVLIMIVTAIILIVAIPCKANAGLQANKGGKALTNATANGFFKSIRRMEVRNGTLGKNASLDDKYVDTTGNGIDSHMALNTEFGTAAILSLSEYGFNPTKDNDSTTGNESGIYNLKFGKYEYTAGLYNISDLQSKNTISEILNADKRYYNEYSDSMTRRPGDISKNYGGYGFNFSSSYFIALQVSGVGLSYSDVGGRGSDMSSRAVVVCGQGL